MSDMNDTNIPGSEMLRILDERVKRNDSRVEALSRVLENAVESISGKMETLEKLAVQRDTGGQTDTGQAMLSARIEDITDSITTLSADIQGIRRSLTETSGSIMQLRDDFEGYKFASKLVDEDANGAELTFSEGASTNREAITDIAAAVTALSDKLDESSEVITSLRSDNRRSVEDLTKRLEGFEATNRSNTLSIGQAVEALVNRIEQIEQESARQHETFQSFSSDNVAPYIADVEREMAENAPKGGSSDHLFDRIASASADAYSAGRTLRPKEADEAPLSSPGERNQQAYEAYDEHEQQTYDEAPVHTDGTPAYDDAHEDGGPDSFSHLGMDEQHAQNDDPAADVPEIVESSGGLGAVEGEHRRTKKQAAGEYEQEFDAEDYEEKPRSVADIRSKMRAKPQPTDRKSQKTAAVVEEEGEASRPGLLDKLTSAFSSRKRRRTADKYDLPEEEFEADFTDDDDRQPHPNAHISAKDSDPEPSSRRHFLKRKRKTETDSFVDEFEDDWDEGYASGGSNKRFMLLGAAVLVAGIVLGLALFGID